MLEFMSGYVADPISPHELYASAKKSFEGRPEGELRKAPDQRESEFKDANRA